MWKGNINESSLTFRFAVSERLAAGEVVIVSVQFVNPWAAQEAAQNVRIAAIGHGDEYLEENVDFDDASILPFPGARPGDASPFKVLSAGFTSVNSEHHSVCSVRQLHERTYNTLCHLSEHHCRLRQSHHGPRSKWESDGGLKEITGGWRVHEQIAAE